MDAISPGQRLPNGHQVQATPHFCIASDHWWVRRAIAALLHFRYPGAQIEAGVASASNGRPYILVTDQPQLAKDAALVILLGQAGIADWQQDEALVLAAIEAAVVHATGEDIWSHPPARRRQGSPGSLTRRQQDVLACLAQGQSNAAIAGALGMSENTVRIHVSAILKALGMDNRTQAALWANGRVAGSR
jgi:DNA-binding CsgD family transcriptional regulator